MDNKKATEDTGWAIPVESLTTIPSIPNARIKEIYYSLFLLQAQVRFEHEQDRESDPSNISP